MNGPNPFPRERLSLALAPLPGEALDSWIEAYSRQLIVTSHDFLAFVGLPRTHPERLVTKLLPEELNVLARRTGVEPDVLRAMTLEPFDKITVKLRHQTRGLASPPHWRRHKGSRYCSACLAESGGRWLLSWRSPWSFACTRHSQLLIETCPGCGHRPHPSGRHPAGVTSPAHCTMARGLAQPSGLARNPCNTDLAGPATRPIPSDGRIMKAQHFIDGLVRTQAEGDREEQNRRTSLGELFFLAWRCLATLHDDSVAQPPPVSKVLAEVGGHSLTLLTGLSNESSIDVAVGTALAMTALDNEHPHSDAVVHWIADSHLRKDGAMELQLKLNSWRSACSPAVVARALPVIDTRLLPIDRLRFGTASPTPRIPSAGPDQIERRAAGVPTTLWPSWSMRLMPHAIGGPRGMKTAEFRTGLSALLLSARSRSRTYGDGLALLGNPVPSSFVKSMIGRLDPQYLAPLLYGLSQLADALDTHGSPIDYARRRELAARPDLTIDRHAFDELAAQHGWRQYAVLTFDTIDGYLKAIMTADHVTYWSLRSSREVQKRRTILRFRADPPLRAFLLDQAAGHLNRLGIDEPVLWEPPATWATDVDWPGTDPAAVDEEKFRDCAVNYRKLSDIAEAMGLGIEHIRLYAEITGTITTTQRRGPRKPRPARTPPSATVLRDLYSDKGLSLRQTRAATGCSIDVITRGLQDAGIAIRKRGIHAYYPPVVDREWLHEQHVVRCRGIADIADEVGVTRTTIRATLRRGRIPLRHGTGVPRNFAATTRGLDLPPLVYRAFVGRGSVTRMRQVCALLNHPSLAAAAAEAGTDRQYLRRKLSLVEGATGVRIVQTLSPLELTSAGRTLLQHSLPVIDRFDQSCSS